MSLSPETIGVGAAGGGVVGFLIGFAAKKIAKLVLVLIGAILAGLAGLEKAGYITGVDWKAINGDISGFLTGFQSLAMDTVSTASTTINTSGSAIGVGFLLGTALGLRRG